MAGSMSVAGASKTMSLNIVTVSACVISGPDASTTGTSAATFTRIVAAAPTYR
jgi:hypothetical protein